MTEDSEILKQTDPLKPKKVKMIKTIPPHKRCVKLKNSKFITKENSQRTSGQELKTTGPGTTASSNSRLI